MKSKAMDSQKKVKDFLKLEKILEKQPSITQKIQFLKLFVESQNEREA